VQINKKLLSPSISFSHNCPVKSPGLKISKKSPFSYRGKMEPGALAPRRVFFLLLHDWKNHDETHPT
jgi:hypothetical protein